jgi:hypothetical protein
MLRCGVDKYMRAENLLMEILSFKINCLHGGSGACSQFYPQKMCRTSRAAANAGFCLNFVHGYKVITNQ